MNAGAENLSADLEACLDRIWHGTGRRRDEAIACLRSLSQGGVYHAISYDLASFLELRPSLISIDVANRVLSFTFSHGDTSFMIGNEPSGNYVIQYPDVGYVAALQEGRGVPLPVFSKIQSLEQLLVGLQLCRDHIDSVLYLPRQMRSQRMTEYASEAGMSDDQFKYLAAHYTRLSSVIKVG